MSTSSLNLTVSDISSRLRIDKFLQQNATEYSRSYFQTLIKGNRVKVNGEIITPNYKVKNNDVIVVNFPPEKNKIPVAEDLKVEIVFENDDLAVICKPQNMVVHPTDDGNQMSGTLVNALLNMFGKEGLSDLGGEVRPGIVHRLDKDTTGLLIITKNNKIHEYIVNLMKTRQIEKYYMTLVIGHIPNKTGTIEAALARAKHDRKKMNITDSDDGKHALTEFEVQEYLEYGDMQFTLVKAKIITGRTHQIRVHFRSIGYPVVGDELYGNRKMNAFANKHSLHRQFLHAAELKFNMPDGTEVHVKKELPNDLRKFLDFIQ
jgi:23S rRNA pseudouridine1911/1915/1917 synthase